MKNLFFALALIFTTSISFANESILKGSVDCISYAIDSADAEEDTYGPMSNDDWVDAAMWYYDACNEANGNILVPVFLK